MRRYNNMAINYKKWGKVDKALEAYENSLRLKLADPNVGPSHPKTATTLNNSALLRKHTRPEMYLLSLTPPLSSYVGLVLPWPSPLPL